MEITHEEAVRRAQALAVGIKADMPQVDPNKVLSLAELVRDIIGVPEPESHPITMDHGFATTDPDFSEVTGTMDPAEMAPVLKAAGAEGNDTIRVESLSESELEALTAPKPAPQPEPTV